MKLVILLLIALSVTIAWQTSVLAKQSEASVINTSTNNSIAQTVPNHQ